MNVIKSDEMQVYSKADLSLRFVKYLIDDDELECALVTKNGSYPDNGQYVFDTKSKELLFCTDGKGIVETKSRLKKSFQKNNILLFPPGENYRFITDCSFIVVCAPS